MSLIEPNIWERSSWKAKVAVLVGVLILIAIILWAFSGGHKDETPLITNIGIDNGKNAVITNLVENKEQEVKNAEENSNQLGNAFNQSINRPANQFSSNGTAVDARYCRNFPTDPACRPR